jgi:hypothetical protein
LRAKRSNLDPQIHAYLDRACFVARKSGLPDLRISDADLG